MEGSAPSPANDAAVSVAETADSYVEEEEASLLGTSGADPDSEGYPQDETEVEYLDREIDAHEKFSSAPGEQYNYYVDESGEYPSMAGAPASTVAGDGAPSPSTSPHARPTVAFDPSLAIDRSAPVSAPNITSQASSVAPPSVSLGSPRSSDEGNDAEYSGMPTVDADIEVGKKIVRRRKLSVACPPSSFHADIQPPGLELVQRALRDHKSAGIRPFKRVQPRLAATEFHDEKGHMLLHGCLEGKYVGDVLGGLPHGHGQHWTPSTNARTPDFRHLLYEGAWEYGAKTGYGRMFYTNGQEYRGHFKEGERHGRGAMHYLDGTVYDGEWFKGRRHGLGTSYYKDGGFYKGAWCKDNRDGWGAYYWPSKCRKYEGEWVGDDPVCGNATNITKAEYDSLKGTAPDWCNVKDQLPESLPEEQLQLPLMELRNPELSYYPHACARRQHRIDLKRGALKEPPDPKVVVEHNGSLTPQQMQALRLAFDKLSPGYYRRSMVNRVQIRRLILLARLDPDSEMGRRLFINLQEATIQTVGLTYNSFMKTILAFHYP